MARCVIDVGFVVSMLTGIGTLTVGLARGVGVAGRAVIAALIRAPGQRAHALPLTGLSGAHGV